MRLLLQAILPEIILTLFAGVLLMMGVGRSLALRRLAPYLALAALIIAGATQLPAFLSSSSSQSTLVDPWQTVRIFQFARFIKILASAIGVMLVLLAWPASKDASGNAAMNFGTESGEFYALMLLSIAGVFLVAGANDIIMLFLGIELAAIPTYVMVSISRPLAVAQEAGVKYFFLGAMAAALMLFGFSYLYGTTGTTKLLGSASDPGIAQILASQSSPLNPAGPVPLSPWQTMAVVMLIAGFAFKMAVVPLHVYAPDVYQGAATPVTAFLSFVPKISGFVALIKILYVVSGGMWQLGDPLVKLIWWLSVLTMTFGNMLGLLQFNVKRVLAYSSIAHSGYMLAAVAALVSTSNDQTQANALQGILFYLTAYGLMNIGAFGVLILLPAGQPRPATSAETFDDLAGTAREYPVLGLAMAVSCFSLIGLPLTIGFFGKLYLIRPALQARLYGLVALLVINALISAGYYLKIVGTMYLRPQPAAGPARPEATRRTIPIMVAVGLSMVGVLYMGIVLPETQRLTVRTQSAAHLEPVSSGVVGSASAR